jgi:hypothetical protein
VEHGATPADKNETCNPIKRRKRLQMLPEILVAGFEFFQKKCFFAFKLKFSIIFAALN